MPDNALSSTTTSNGVDCEPDSAWKENLRKRIEEGLQSMVDDAKENHARELSKAPDTREARMRLEADHKEVMKTINSLATEQYKLELDRERNQRRWTAGVPMTPGWSQFFHQEQQNIMNSIKQSNQTDNSVRTASESPTEERRSSGNEHPALAPTTTSTTTSTTTPVLLPVPPSPSVPPPAEEREQSFVSPPQSLRRGGSDVRSTLSGERDDHGSFSRRNHHASSVRVRPSLPNNWVADEIVDEPEELLRSPPPRTRLSSIDRPSQPSPASPDIRCDSSLGRSSGSIHSAEPRSPPIRAPPPEVWNPAISPAEDPSLPPSAKLYRRGSAASMRSTGSGASIRPSITEPILEQADDDDDDSPDDESDMEENDYEPIEQVRPRISTTTTKSSRDKKKRPLLRRDSRQSSVDAGTHLRSDSDLGLRPDDRHHRPPIDSPAKPPPYYDHRDSQQSSPRDSYPHRDQQQVLFPPPPPPQDPRPIPARTSYGVDDSRDYGPQYSSIPHNRPHGPKPPPYHLTQQRESRPISRQVSFTRQPTYLELDDENFERERSDRGVGRGRDRDRDRERNWGDYDRDGDRDRDGSGGGRDIHSATTTDLRRSSTTTNYPYSASRHSTSSISSTYPNPSTTPVSSSRPVPQDYDFHDDWESGPRYNSYRSPPPPDILEYHHQRRPDSAAPRTGPGLSRQSSHVRLQREDPDRRFSGDNGS